MILQATLTRRLFLRTVLWLGALGLSRPARILARTHGLGASDPLVSNLKLFFTRGESARVVGREYLRDRSGEADIRLAVDLIYGPQAEWGLAWREAGFSEFRKLIRGQIRRDFDEGRTVKVQGWILSKTEARLCALVYLLDKSS
jgi:hypothetical protein